MVGRNESTRPAAWRRAFAAILGRPRNAPGIEPPGAGVILAARHLDATEGPVRVGSTVDDATRSAINKVLDYVAKAHNTQRNG